MRITARRLAELAERSPGYSVTLLGYGQDLTNIRFGVQPSGRRNLRVVRADSNLGPCTWDADIVLTLED